MSPSKNLISDDDIANCNKVFLRKNITCEAEEIWKIGRCLGIVGKGNDKEIITRLVEMELRDRNNSPNANELVRMIGDQSSSQ